MNLLVRRPAKPEGHVTFGGRYIIDPLAAETDAQRTERKKAEREASPGWLHVLGVVVAFVLIAGVFAAVGTVIGNQRNADVTDLWPTSVPSGQRAEPKEGVR